MFKNVMVEIRGRQAEVVRISPTLKYQNHPEDTLTVLLLFTPPFETSQGRSIHTIAASVPPKVYTRQEFLDLVAYEGGQELERVLRAHAEVDIAHKEGEVRKAELDQMVVEIESLLSQ